MIDLEHPIALDIETYPNYTLFAFRATKPFMDSTYKYYNRGNNPFPWYHTVEVCSTAEDGFSDDQKDFVKYILTNHTTYGFNSNKFDMPLIYHALLDNANSTDLYNAASDIIHNHNYYSYGNSKDNHPWTKKVRHFDLMEVPPGVNVGLKLYAARMHSPKLQDLPYEPDKKLTHNEKKEVVEYCKNDLDVTAELYDHIKKEIKLRLDMSIEYKQDLMSKSDAQIAEAVFRSELKKIYPARKFCTPNRRTDSIINYEVPKDIAFETEDLKFLPEYIANTDFTLNSQGSIVPPKEFRQYKIHINENSYQIGVGGLHSCEKKFKMNCGDGHKIIDADVTSYYPSIIRKLQLYPTHLGHKFLDIYGDIVDKRIQAKIEKDKVVADSLKIVINGTFGKFGSKYSLLYSPELLLQTTITGQLMLLMLIEKIESYGLPVLSANTDGIMVFMNNNDDDLFQMACKEWETQVGMNLEFSECHGLFSRDVNNYFAVKPDKTTKCKGIFASDPLKKNPQGEICAIAAMEYVINQTPLEDTIRSDDYDITDYLFVRTVKGGSIWKDEYLGKVARWVYAKDGSTILYKNNDNKVPKSDRSQPIMGSKQGGQVHS